jgi:2-haloalkanoic acid dehalogenase type II
MPRNNYKAVMFDLYTALLDSWSLWNRIAGSAVLGAVWRKKYLELTYQAGPYRSYDGIIAEAAQKISIAPERTAALIQNWSALEPWPETWKVVGAIAERMPIAVATNSSIELARIAVATIGVAIPIVVTAEESGYYKPQPRTYRLALERLGCEAEEVLFVAGSASDVPGATNVGMPVYWHNRIHQRPADEKIKPRYESDSLLPLLDLI